MRCDETRRDLTAYKATNQANGGGCWTVIGGRCIINSIVNMLSEDQTAAARHHTYVSNNCKVRQVSSRQVRARRVLLLQLLARYTSLNTSTYRPSAILVAFF